MESNTNKNVLIGLSGGVDSAVAAYLLKNDGFTVKAATLKMSDAPAKDSADTASADAAASDDISDAAAVAGQLGIEHFVVDLRERFRESVINYFVESYLSGETPNPCVFCNRNMKFPCMAEFAKSVGCGFVATGHYAVVKKDAASGRYLLLKGADKKKDQSYMLYALNQEMLSKVIFPLGNLTKEKIRGIAGDIHLNVASKRDSQDICFIRDGDYSGFIRNFTGMTPKSGSFCRCRRKNRRNSQRYLFIHRRSKKRTRNFIRRAVLRNRQGCRQKRSFAWKRKGFILQPCIRFKCKLHCL